MPLTSKLLTFLAPNAAGGPSAPEGQLTAEVHLANADLEKAQRLLPIFEERFGRILINGLGTGVEVCHAMMHGGPHPATSDSRSTSVRSLAIRRFPRARAYQDVPDDLRPESLRENSAPGLPA